MGFAFPKNFGGAANMKKLKKAVIREELVALTGDFKKAIVLNQMIYWSERVKDKDLFLEAEIKRSTMAMGKEEYEKAEKIQEMEKHLMSYGWIYKSATELSEETMIGCSKSTMHRYLEELVQKEWLSKRKNPNWKGDNTFQYRVNLINIQKGLQILGYALEGYPLFQNETPMFYDETPKYDFETDSSKIEQAVLKRNNITIDYSESTSKDFEREDIIILEILKNYNFSSKDSIMIQHHLYAENHTNGVALKKHLIIKQASTMDSMLKRGEPIFSKPAYFINGYLALIQAEQVHEVEKDKRKVKKAEEKTHEPVPFYNWLEQ